MELFYKSLLQVFFFFFFFFSSFKILFRLKGPVVAFVNATISLSIFLAWAIVVFLKHCYRSKEPFFPIAIFRRFYSDILKHCANSSIFKGLQQCFNNATIGLGLIRTYSGFCKTLLQGLLKIKKNTKKKNLKSTYSSISQMPLQALVLQEPIVAIVEHCYNPTQKKI